MNELEEIIIVLGVMVTVCSIPLTAIVTAHKRSHTKLQIKMLEKEVELEKMRLEMYDNETERMKIELEQSKQLLLESQQQVLSAENNNN
ncbi:hypothetical protein [Lysinibacillus sp. 54212]|uniref:hypothetical protein n=1 Tax=Lysinibacillus sp. 54212 TaxID=3119829 RepID=UPI002FC699CE